MFLCLLLVNHCCHFLFYFGKVLGPPVLLPVFVSLIMYLSYFTHVSLLSCAFWSQLSPFPGGRLVAGLFQQHILFSFASEFGSLVKEVSYLPASEAWNVTCSCCNKSSLYLFMRENGGTEIQRAHVNRCLTNRPAVDVTWITRDRDSMQFSLDTLWNIWTSLTSSVLRLMIHDSAQSPAVDVPKVDLCCFPSLSAIFLLFLWWAFTLNILRVSNNDLSVHLGSLIRVWVGVEMRYISISPFTTSGCQS